MHHVRNILIDLLKIKSVSKREGELAKYLASQIKKMGFDVSIQEKNTFNVIVKGSMDFFIVTHIDTIDRDTSIQVKGDRIYATGSSDAKASVAAILAFLKKTRKLNVSIAFLGDEEEDAEGSEIFLESYKPEMAVVMEPTSMRLCPYHAGNVELVFELCTEESHGSFCIKNPIDLFVEMYTKLKDLDCWKRGKYFESCFSIQDISTNNPFYLNPGICKGRIEIRTLPEQKAEEISSRVLNVVKIYGKGIVKEKWDGFSLGKNEEIVRIVARALKESNLECIMDGMPSWTDAIRLNEKGVKTVVIGPGNLKYSHTNREFVDLVEIVNATEFLLKLNEIVGNRKADKMFS